MTYHVSMDPLETARKRKMFVLAREIGLKDEERWSLAEMILRRDITSWSQLDDAQVRRMLDALEGYQLITEIRRQRS
jgi:hypothetical protein